MSSNTQLTVSSRPALWQWLHAKGYAQGVFWAIMVCLVSNLNDVFTRFSGTRLEGTQVAFLRFFFSTLILLPLMFYNGRASFTTKHPVLHSMRALLVYGAFACWCTGVTMVPLTTASTLAQTVALFTLPMAFLFLKEKVGWQRTLATLGGFLGILFVIQPEDGGSLFAFEGLNLSAFWLLSAAIMFAGSDILNKKMVSHESGLKMLFYSAAGTAFLGIIPAWMVWVTPTSTELIYLFVAGAGSNLILYCLLKAFAAADISALLPYRYVELLFAGGFGFVLFGEIPGMMTLIGAAIIVPCTLFIAYYETRIRNQTTDKGSDAPSSTAPSSERTVSLREAESVA